MSPIVREAGELSMAGFETVGVISEEQLKLIFKTVAKECKNRDEQMLYLMKCKANGLSPLKGQLYATRRSDELVFVTAYSVFVSRSRRAGFVIHGECVCEGDAWGGWDAAELKPIKHHISVDQQAERGEIIGAYAYATELKSGQRLMGGWWNWSELITDAGKIDRKDGFMWRRIPQHMAKRVAWLRVARMIAPDLDSLYGAEEFGKIIPDADDAEVTKIVPPTDEPTVIDVTDPGQTDDEFPQDDAQGEMKL
jgi:hypothetical protein